MNRVLSSTAALALALCCVMAGTVGGVAAQEPGAGNPHVDQ